jgi:hypothetical protein
LDFKKKNTKKGIPSGLGGPNILFYPKAYSICDLKFHAKYYNPTITPSGRKVCGREKKKREKNNPKISGHLVLLQRLRAAYALSSDQHYGRISNSRGKTTRIRKC